MRACRLWKLRQDQPTDGTVQLRQWTQSDSRYFYTLTLREVETLNIEVLVLGDLEIHPYQYMEDSLEGLKIDGKVELSEEDSEKFLQLQSKGGYFPVIRRGIQEEAREMRFGAVYWSSGNGTVKYAFVLVEKTPADEASSLPLGQLEPKVRSYLAFEVALRKGLIELLQEKGIISSEEVTGLKEKAESEKWRVENEFYRVEDVDRLL